MIGLLRGLTSSVVGGRFTCATVSAAAWSSGVTGSNESWKTATSIYDFTATDIDANDVSFEKYKGHVCIIVNVASKWGVTARNYQELQALHDQFAESGGLRILCFPCNQFGSQEPGSDAEVKEFVQGKYGVNFDLFSKIKVNGKDADPLWKYLKSKQGGTLGDLIKWNFSKFLIGKNGQPVQRYSTTDHPFAMLPDIEKYLQL